MMRTLKLSCLLLFAVSLFTACKKDNDDIASPTIVGFWKGQYGTGNSNPTEPYGQLFRSDGTTRVYFASDTTKESKGEGTYVVSNGAVNTTYTIDGVTRLSTAASLDSAMTVQVGTFGFGTNISNAGRFYLQKQ